MAVDSQKGSTEGTATGFRIGINGSVPDQLRVERQQAESVRGDTSLVCEDERPADALRSDSRRPEAFEDATRQVDRGGYRDAHGSVPRLNLLDTSKNVVQLFPDRKQNHDSGGKMSDVPVCQFKVWAFLKRNTALLSHDEYRAGHVGFHCGNTRRLKGIRGYTVNIHDEQAGLGAQLGGTGVVTVKGEPEGFLELWDGFPAVHFDDRQQWTQATTPEPTRATADGLVVDPDWTVADGPYLFDRVSNDTTQFRSYHTRVEEHVVCPVFRSEARPFKLVQFYRAAEGMSRERFRERVLHEYSPLCAAMERLNGLVVNFRDPDIDAAVRGYYPENHWCFTADGRAFRKRFFELWDGASEFWFDCGEDFLAARRDHPLLPQLRDLERELFAALWYVRVDENVIVMPNRLAPPPFYYR